MKRAAAPRVLTLVLARYAYLSTCTASVIAQQHQHLSLRGTTAALLASGHHATAEVLGASEPGPCGPVTAYPNARPKNYQDSQKTRYSVETNQHVPVTFAAGQKIPFECLPGFSIDGSKTGRRDFDVECAEQGYFKPAAVCLEASPCGPVPEIEHARPTGQPLRGAVQFECAHGFSLDGQPVVPGGHRANQLFELKCIQFNGEYEAFKGSCKPFAFMPASRSIHLYGQLFEALFISSCKGTLKTAFGSGQPTPSGLDKMCGKFADHAVAGCQALVDKIKADYEVNQTARKEHDKNHKQDGLPISDEAAPNINDEAHAFCENIWKLVEMPASTQ